MHEETGIISYVHGNKNQLMKIEDYRRLKNCTTIEDLKEKLQTSPLYGKDFLDESQITLKSFKQILYKCLQEQINTALAFSTKMSRQLVDFYLEYFQISNFIYLWACKQENPKSLEGSLKLHPLGMYNGLNFVKVTQSTEDTWKYCLENTPLQRYMAGLTHELLKEDIQYIMNIFLKRYIEMLYQFSVENSLCLQELMLFEGDKRIIEVLHSTVGTTVPVRDKTVLFPECTTFSQMQKTHLLACKSVEELTSALSSHQRYRSVIGSEMGVEDALRREEIRICKRSFLYYDDPSVVYTQLKLQELEIVNLTFLADCISQGRTGSINEILDIEESQK